MPSSTSNTVDELRRSNTRQQGEAGYGQRAVDRRTRSKVINEGSGENVTSSMTDLAVRAERQGTARAKYVRLKLRTGVQRTAEVVEINP